MKEFDLYLQQRLHESDILLGKYQTDLNLYVPESVMDFDLKLGQYKNDIDLYIKDHLTQCDIIIEELTHYKDIHVTHRMILASCLMDCVAIKEIAVLAESTLVSQVDRVMKKCYAALDSAAELEEDASASLLQYMETIGSKMTLLSHNSGSSAISFSGAESTAELLSGSVDPRAEKSVGYIASYIQLNTHELSGALHKFSQAVYQVMISQDASASMQKDSGAESTLCMVEKSEAEALRTYDAFENTSEISTSSFELYIEHILGYISSVMETNASFAGALKKMICCLSFSELYAMSSASLRYYVCAASLYVLSQFVGGTSAVSMFCAQSNANIVAHPVDAQIEKLLGRMDVLLEIVEYLSGSYAKSYASASASQEIAQEAEAFETQYFGTEDAAFILQAIAEAATGHFAMLLDYDESTLDDMGNSTINELEFIEE